MPSQFSVKYLSANNNVNLLIEQSKEFKPDVICIVNESYIDYAKQKLKNYDIEILYGVNGLNEISKINDIDLALNAIVGSAGMRPTYNIVSSSIDLALANKESLVMAGKLIMNQVNKNKSNISDTPNSTISNKSNTNNETSSNEITVSFNNSKNFSIYNQSTNNSRELETLIPEESKSNDKSSSTSFKDRLNQVDMK